MSSQYVGVETARKTLGDLVAQAQEGTETVLTRNGRPVARIVAYVSEDTMTTVDLSQTAAAVIARARTNADKTAPEFDYDIATHFDKSANGIGGLGSPLGGATYELATEGMPETATADEREAVATELWEQLQTELQAYARRCRDRKYTGWSYASRGRGARIAYAD